MSRKAIFAVVALGMSLSAGVASAGARVVYDVFVTTAGGAFWGALGSARNSADGIQYIGCYSSATIAGCYARSTAATNNFLSCSTTDPALMETIRSVTGDSFVSVNVSGSTCTAVNVHNTSYFAPKSL